MIEIKYTTKDLQIIDPVLQLLYCLKKNLQLNTQQEFQLRLILTELYHNALDHGILGLESDIKDQIMGMQKYLDSRNDLLASKTGEIKFAIQHIHLDNYLQIQIEHNGEGGKKFPRDLASNNKYYGRGIFLVTQFARNLRYNHEGRQVTVEYQL